MMLEQLWDRIEALHGQTLFTFRGKPFEVVSIERGKAVTVLPKSTGNPRGIKAEEFERAYQLRLNQGPLTATALLNAGVSEWNPVYVAAIVKAVA